MAKYTNGKISSEEQEEQPIFNLKAVVQETGLKPDTLRAWERRYGMPHPERTDGGHRLYSRRDIETLKWLIARQNEGMSISRAISMWHTLLTQGQNPLKDELTTAVDEPSHPYQKMTLGPTVNELRQEWIDTCLEFDEQAAERVLTQAFAFYQPEIVCFEVLQKGLAEIGQGWYQGIVSVQKEHFASALALRRLDALLAATPPPIRNGRLLIGCAPKDDHTFSPLLIALLLRRQGWDVVYLGANVPLDQLENTIATTQPHLVIFSAQLLHTAANLQQLAYVLREKKLPLAYGGLVFNIIPKLRDSIPGHFLGTELEKVPQVVEHLLIQKPSLPLSKRPSPEYSQTLTHFQQRVGLIEADIWEQLIAQGMKPGDITNANSHLGQNIQAALMLGNMAFIGSDITWLEGLLVNYKLPIESLHLYLQAYNNAAHAHLHDVTGAPVLFWLGKTVASVKNTHLRSI